MTEYTMTVTHCDWNLVYTNTILYDEIQLKLEIQLKFKVFI
jgi:hypothetical protein